MALAFHAVLYIPLGSGHCRLEGGRGTHVDWLWFGCGTHVDWLWCDRGTHIDWLWCGRGTHVSGYGVAVGHTLTG